jgi:uncharacterized protein (DUF433 family)
VEDIRTPTDVALDKIMLEAKMTDRIEINPSVMLGKPVIRGTRIPVELLLRKLSEGASMADLLEAYPRLTEKDIKACLGYAASIISHEEVHTLIEG